VVHVGKGQAWSIDLVIGVLIFLLVIGLFYVLLIRNFDEDTSELEIASETIATKLVDEEGGIISENQVNKDQLKALADKKYDDLKKELEIGTDFCIFLEDEEGNVINITDSSGNSFVGIGSSKINISGSACGGG
jgi:Tfp pilus assembly protein PilO